MKQESVKFAVMGYGRIGKRHAEMIMHHPLASLVAVVDEDEQKRDREITFFTSLDEAINHCAIDAICIATPNGLHAQHAIKALSLGKHVVIEKPLALSAKDARAVVDLAVDKGKHAFVVMQNRYSPVIRWLKEVVDSGVLGRIFIVQVNCLWNRNETYYQQSNWHGTKSLDGGTLFTQFSHFVDLMHWLFGDIENVRSRFYNHNHVGFTEFEDSGLVSFDFKNGAAGSLQFTTSVWEKSLESTVTIIAENGSIKIGGQYMDRLEYCLINNYELPDLKNYQVGSTSPSNHYYVINDVVETILGKNIPSYPIRDAVEVVRMTELMYQSENK